MKKILIRISICTVLLLSLILVSGCGDKEDEQPIVNPIEITISINYPDKSQLEDVEAETFKVEEGSTVLEAIQLFCNVKDIPLNIEITDGSVDGINDVNNHGLYKDRVWKYKLNDELYESPENNQVLANGDKLQWVYKK